MNRSPKKLVFKILAFCLILAAAYFLNRQGMAGRLLAWAEGLGPWAAPAILTIYLRRVAKQALENQDE